jgi:hypothetical protein
MNEVIKDVISALNKHAPLHPVEIAQVASYLFYWSAKGYTDDKIEHELNLYKNELRNRKQFNDDFVELLKETEIKDSGSSTS